MNASAWVAALALGVVAAPVAGQTFADRVQALGTRVARVTYATREGVAICERGITVGDRRSDRWNGRCVSGNAVVEVVVRDGVVRDVEVLELDDLPTAGTVDLGVVDAGEVASYFVALARGWNGQAGVEDAVFVAAIADVPDLWVELLALARDRGADGDVRGEALFWLGQDAAAAVSTGIAEVAADEREEQEVREAAVFALSQRPPAEGVPLLMEIARGAEEAETRETAMFWLAQHQDERVLAFFEEILLGRQPR
jgi:hypothetical protein